MSRVILFLFHFTNHISYESFLDDGRVNVQSLLTMIHLVFTKHHNLVAEKLADLNPNWDHEKLLEVSSYGTVMYTSIFISWLLLRH